MEWNHLGSRRGRPRRSWGGEVDEAMEKTGLDDKAWENRNVWRVVKRRKAALAVSIIHDDEILI